MVTPAHAAFVLAASALVAAGCAEQASTSSAADRGGGQAGSVSDSAGVTIRTDPTPVDELPVIATVADTPSVTLGLDESNPAELFVEVGDIASHPDHGVAVADVGALDVRLFDWSGRHRGTIGGPGEGPGEFGRISSIEGDSTLWVWDSRRGRASRFTWGASSSRTSRSRPPRCRGAASCRSRPPAMRWSDGTKW